MMIIGIAVHQKMPRKAPLQAPASTCGRGNLAHRINRAIDTVLDIDNAKKVIGEAGMDKLVSAVAHMRPSAWRRPAEATTPAHSHSKDGGDLK
ncbi:hypothetical protein [Janthinobacterium sp. RT4P48]|uniref:hypothetical protein n=1 Tax=Janthinobacterium sp. RT4P48 TaxID=3424188 RepID=UPI003F2645E8